MESQFYATSHHHSSSQVKFMSSKLDNQPGADILVVDDLPDNIRLLSTMLTEHGYNVRKALGGHMALIATAAMPPDLILLDVNMPGMSGYEVCQKLKEDSQTSSVPIIFLSALDDVLDKVKAFKLGAVDYITKPFQIEEVLARIETQLTIQSLQAQSKQQNIQLQKALDELTMTQTQLIQKEKMVALGQLVAGLAHEINNPVSFISGNLLPARRYTQDLLDLIRLYQQEYPEPTPAIEQAIADLDLDFLAIDLPKLFTSIQTGAERISTIIIALRIFSRLDEAALKAVDIHQGIDSALLLLRHRLLPTVKHAEITIIKNYGEVPPITCYASQMNQVFLNLLDNAIDALEARYATNVLEAKFDSSATPFNQPTIWITTQLIHPDKITIQIKDNGVGIPTELQSQLFNPFFTTKPVGKGTGLGLSTSHQIIVEKHQGRLSVVSTPGEGSEFTIAMPIKTVGN